MKPSISLTQPTLPLLSLSLIIIIWSCWATSPAMAHKTDECGNINNQIALDIENNCIDDAWERFNIAEIDQPNKVELDTTGNLIVAGSEQDDIIVLTIDEQNLMVGGLLDLPDESETSVRTLDNDKAQVALDQINDHIVLDTKGGNDTLIVEFDGATLTKPIFFEGGAQPGSGQGDVLEIRGSATVSSATLNFINPHDGSVQLAGQAPIHYRGLEPISFSLTPSVVVLDYDTTAETITISDSGTAGQTTIASTNGETLTITNPVASLQINAGDTGDDVINVDGFGSGFAAALTIDGQGGADTINVNTSLNLDGDLSLSGESINLNDGTMSTGAGTNGGTIDLTGAITLGTDIVIDANGSSSGGDITFSGEVDGGYGLTANTSGTTLFDENIGSTTSLTTVTTDAGGTTVMRGSGSSTNNSAIITTGAQTYNDTVLIATNTSLKSSTSIFFGDTIDSQSGNRALILNFITWGTLSEAVGASQPLSALLVNTNGTTLIKGGEVTTTGIQEYYNNIEVDSVSNTTTLSAGSANVRLGQTSNNDVRSSTAGEDSLIIDTTGTTNLYAQVGRSGSQNLDQLTFNGPLTMHTGVVNTTGAQTYGSTITLEADSVLDSSSSGDITLSGEVDGGYGLTVNTSGTTLFDENIGSTTSLTTVTTDAGGTTVMQGSGSSTNNSAIITTGAQTYNDTVLIATNTSLKSSTSIFFGDTIDSQSGNRALILNFITWGTLSEAVGASQPLSALLVNTNGTTLIKGGEVTTTGKQEYYNNIEVDAASNTTTLSAGSANVRLGNTSNNDVRSSTAGEDSLIIDTTGTTNLYAQVGKSGSQNLDQLTFNGPITIRSSLVRTSGDQTYNDTMTLTSDVTLTADDVSLLSSVDNGGFDLSVDVAGTASSITGVVSGSGGLVKEGDGTLALTAANTYTGTTTVSTGTLQANNSSGSATSTEQVTVDDGGTLAGTGTVAGSTVVNTNGSVAPGTSPGLLTTGDLSLNDSAILAFEINGTTAGTEYDQIKVNGNVNLASSGSGGVLSATIGFSPVPANQTFLLIDNDGSDAVVGTFADLPEGELFTIDDHNYSISYVGGDGNDVVLQAEPASLTVIKEASLQDGTDFDFTWTSGAFTLDDALPDDGDGITDTEFIVNLNPGTYAITETVPFGWHLSSAVCTGGSDSGNLNGTTLSVLIGLGEHVVCTFNNTPNTDPVATDDVYTTDEEVTLTVDAPGVLDNDSDTDGDPLSAALVDDVSNGTLSFSSDGSFVFTPTVDFAGSDTFTYSVNDENGGVVTATVDITVNNVNDAPVLASIDNQTITETVELTFTATATDIDLPAQTLRYGLSNEPSGASINSSGLFSWTPSNAQGPGVYTFTMVVSDTGSLTDSQQLEVTVTDLDIDYSVEVAPTSVTEGDSSTQPITFTVTRSGAIGFASQVDYSFGGTATPGDDYSGSTTTVNFAADEISQTVVVTIMDDSVVEADETLSLSLLNGTAPSGGLVSYIDQTVSSTIVDDDSAGITITTIPPLTISEPDDTTTFTITLTSQPTDTVTINLSSSDPSECTVPAAVDLTDLTWQTGITVTVSVVDDLISDGAQLCTVMTSVTSSDPSYSELNPDDVNLTVSDNDVPDVAISTNAVDVTEGGATDQYAFQLTTIPTDTVTISFVTPSQLQPITPITFAADVTALEPLTVTVQAVDDAVVEGDHSGSITHTISGGGYDGVALGDVLVAITDNDQSFAITANQASVMEGDTGATDISFTVTRTGAVTTTVGSVDFTLDGTATSDSDYTNVTPTNGTVSFAAGETQQAIALQVLGDAVVESNETVIVTLANPTGPGNATLTTLSAQTIISDDDTAGFTVAPTSGLTTTETGDTASFSVRLNTQPAANVTVTLTSSDSSEGAISPTKLVFSPSNWQTGQTVTVTGQDDSLADGDIAYLIQTSTDSSDSNYDTLDPDDVDLTNLDNDQPGVEVTPTNLIVQEPNGSDTFTIRLTSQPTDTVTIDLSSSDTTECMVSPASIDLTNLTWQTGITVTVSAVDDGLTDDIQSCTIITSSTSSSDPGYDDLEVPEVNVTVKEVSPIYLPLIGNGGLADQTKE